MRWPGRCFGDCFAADWEGTLLVRKIVRSSIFFVHIKYKYRKMLQ